MPGDGEYLLGHISLLVTFGTPENFRTETLRFEVATFNSYNAIIGRPGLAKFMAVPHYSYLVVKMPAPRGVISVRADFKGMADCTRKALQTALKASASAPQRRLVADAAQLLMLELISNGLIQRSGQSLDLRPDRGRSAKHGWWAPVARAIKNRERARGTKSQVHRRHNPLPQSLPI